MQKKSLLKTGAAAKKALSAAKKSKPRASGKGSGLAAGGVVASTPAAGTTLNHNEVLVRDEGQS